MFPLDYSVHAVRRLCPYGSSVLGGVPRGDTLAKLEKASSGKELNYFWLGFQSLHKKEQSNFAGV